MTATKSFNLIPCQNPIWAPDRHTQTILGDFLPSPVMKQEGERWELELLDGDRVVCRVFEQDSPWVVTLFHGLTGSIHSKYMQRVAMQYLARGYTVILMNHRHCGEGKGLARHPYHCGKSDDLGFVIRKVRERFKGKKILSVGFSMSANSLLLLMSRVVPPAKIFHPDEFEERREELQLDLPDLALTVNAPINLEKTSYQINRALNRIYQFSFMSNLHWLIKDLEKQGILDPAEGLHPLMKVTYFDEKFTAPRSGFESGRHYYDLCSAMKYVHHIERPTVCLMAGNDPFIDVQDYLNTEFSPAVRFQIEDSGGHMGYLHKEKTPLGNFRWLDYGVMEISKELLTAS